MWNPAPILLYPHKILVYIDVAINKLALLWLIFSLWGWKNTQTNSSIQGLGTSPGPSKKGLRMPAKITCPMPSLNGFSIASSKEKKKQPQKNNRKKKKLVIFSEELPFTEMGFWRKSLKDWRTAESLVLTKALAGNFLLWLWKVVPPRQELPSKMFW